MVMTRRQLINTIDAERIEQAIEQAEQQTSGEIRVSVSPFFWGNVRRNAERAFERLGMTNTRNRNGVLIFIVPSRQQFAVLGDEGIHAKVGDAFWNELAEILSSSFKEGHYTEGLVAAIEAVGRRLSEHHPPDEHDNPNQLPNTVDFA